MRKYLGLAIMASALVAGACGTKTDVGPTGRIGGTVAPRMARAARVRGSTPWATAVTLA